MKAAGSDGERGTRHVVGEASRKDRRSTPGADVSRTNHHRRYTRWNMAETEQDTDIWTNEPYEREIQVGMEVYDLRFYAGCRRRPALVHRVLDFHGRYPWRIHYGRDGTAKSYADIREGEFRTAVRRYVDEARAVWNAGGDVEEIHEPDLRPYSIDYDLW